MKTDRGPVQWFEAADVQGQPVLRTGVVVDQPAADASAAVGVFTGSLEGALQHVSTHTAKQALIHIAHKPLQIIAHPTSTYILRLTGQKWQNNKTLLTKLAMLPLFWNVNTKNDTLTSSRVYLYSPYLAGYLFNSSFFQLHFTHFISVLFPFLLHPALSFPAVPSR